MSNVNKVRNLTHDFRVLYKNLKAHNVGSVLSHSSSQELSYIRDIKFAGSLTW